MSGDEHGRRTYRMPYPDRYVPIIATVGGVVGASTFLFWGPSWMWPFGFLFGVVLTPLLLGLALGGPTDGE